MAAACTQLNHVDLLLLCMTKKRKRTNVEHKQLLSERKLGLYKYLVDTGGNLDREGVWHCGRDECDYVCYSKVQRGTKRLSKKLVVTHLLTHYVAMLSKGAVAVEAADSTTCTD
jgi:hypothetical protein